MSAALWFVEPCLAEALISVTVFPNALMAFRFLVSAPLSRDSKDFRFSASVATVSRLFGVFAIGLGVDFATGFAIVRTLVFAVLGFAGVWILCFDIVLALTLVWALGFTTDFGVVLALDFAVVRTLGFMTDFAAGLALGFAVDFAAGLTFGFEAVFVLGFATDFAVGRPLGFVVLGFAAVLALGFTMDFAVVLGFVFAARRSLGLAADFDVGFFTDFAAVLAFVFTAVFPGAFAFTGAFALTDDLGLTSDFVFTSDFVTERLFVWVVFFVGFFAALLGISAVFPSPTHKLPADRRNSGNGFPRYCPKRS